MSLLQAEKSLKAWDSWRYSSSEDVDLLAELWVPRESSPRRMLTTESVRFSETKGSRCGCGGRETKLLFGRPTETCPANGLGSRISLRRNGAMVLTDIDGTAV
ncbi:hypothetical protein ACFX2I_032652 [Malus domestica]